MSVVHQLPSDIDMLHLISSGTRSPYSAILHRIQLEAVLDLQERTIRIIHPAAGTRHSEDDLLHIKFWSERISFSTVLEVYR